MLELLFVIVGAAIALFSYHMGRNNKASVPQFHIPFLHQKPDNGASESPKAPISRGM